jgi:hypothetical protein
MLLPIDWIGFIVVVAAVVVVVVVDVCVDGPDWNRVGGAWGLVGWLIGWLID